MKRSPTLVAVATVLLLVAISLSYADVPQMINYQGRLTDGAGDPLDTTVSMEFAIYDDSTGGLVLWTEAHPPVMVEGGTFSIILGTMAPIDDAVFNQPDRWLGITVGGDPEIQPRTRLITVPYAHRVSTVDGTTGGQIEGAVHFLDSAMTIDQDAIVIGTNSQTPADWVPVKVYRRWNSSATNVNGIRINVHNDASPASISGLVSYGQSDGATTRYGVVGVGGSQSDSVDAGTSIGLSGIGRSGAEAYGIYAYAEKATVEWGAWFDGDVRVTGTLVDSKSEYVIDHPLDPENRYLHHSTVSSSEMLNVYSGNVITDADGIARVVLPDYFEALNKDYRYQLTVIGSFARAVIAEEVHNGEFVIQTDEPNIKVSWQVTGVRKDSFAETYPTQVEVDKPAAERGLYLAPEAFGFGEDKYIKYELRQEIENQQTQQ